MAIISPAAITAIFFQDEDRLTIGVEGALKRQTPLTEITGLFSEKACPPQEDEASMAQTMRELIYLGFEFRKIYLLHQMFLHEAEKVVKETIEPELRAFVTQDDIRVAHYSIIKTMAARHGFSVKIGDTDISEIPAIDRDEIERQIRENFLAELQDTQRLNPRLFETNKDMPPLFIR